MAGMWQYVILGGVFVTVVVLVIGVIAIRKLTGAIEASSRSREKDKQDMAEAAIEETNNLFNKEFHEELRNRGRLHFEKIINENAMFLKQDLDMTIAQLNEYLRKEIAGKLNEEFANYTKAMNDAQQLALDSLHRSATAVDEQRVKLETTMQKDIADREALALKAYEQNLSKIVEHYILEALGDQFDVKSQLPFIMAQMEANKQKILEDMRL